MPEPLVAGLGDAALAAVILVGGGAVLLSWRYRPGDFWLVQGAAFLVLALASLIEAIWWLTAVSIIGGALSLIYAWRLYTGRAKEK